MREVFLERSLLFIEKNNHILLADEKEKLLYGLEGLYISITKLFIVSLIAFFLGFLKEFICILILFNIIRYPGFGFHASKSRVCFISTVILMIGLPYLLISIPLNIITIVSLSIISVSIFFIYAPADTAKRPLTNKSKRLIRKLCAVTLAISYSLIAITSTNLLVSKLFLSALLIETILILPVTYKIFHEPYQNYKRV